MHCLPHHHLTTFSRAATPTFLPLHWLRTTHPWPAGRHGRLGGARHSSWTTLLPCKQHILGLRCPPQDYATPHYAPTHTPHPLHPHLHTTHLHAAFPVTHTHIGQDRGVGRAPPHTHPTPHHTCLYLHTASTHLAHTRAPPHTHLTYPPTQKILHPTCTTAGWTLLASPNNHAHYLCHSWDDGGRNSTCKRIAGGKRTPRCRLPSEHLLPSAELPGSRQRDAGRLARRTGSAFVPASRLGQNVRQHRRLAANGVAKRRAIELAQRRGGRRRHDGA